MLGVVLFALGCLWWFPGLVWCGCLVATPALHEYQLISSPSGVLGVTSFTFTVQAANDAHIALSSNATFPYGPNVLYEIVIGGWAYAGGSNVIRRERQGGFLRIDGGTPDFVSGQFLSANESRAFWVSFVYNSDNSLYLAVGRGNQVGKPGTQFMGYRDPTPIRIQYIGVATGWKASGVWNARCQSPTAPATPTLTPTSAPATPTLTPTSAPTTSAPTTPAPTPRPSSAPYQVYIAAGLVGSNIHLIPATSTCDNRWSVPDQCTVPQGDAGLRICDADPNCVAVNCNIDRKDCQLRYGVVTGLDGVNWPQMNSYVKASSAVNLTWVVPRPPVAGPQPYKMYAQVGIEGQYKMPSTSTCAGGDTKSVVPQCSFPREQAQAACDADPNCAAYQCNTQRNDCQLRYYPLTGLDSVNWRQMTSYVKPLVTFYSGIDLRGSMHPVYEVGFVKTFIGAGYSQCPANDPRLPFTPAHFTKNPHIGFVPMSIQKQPHVQVKLWSNFGAVGDNWCGPSNFVVTQQTNHYSNYSHIAYDRWVQMNAAETGVFQLYTP